MHELVFLNSEFGFCCCCCHLFVLVMSISDTIGLPQFPEREIKDWNS